GIRPPVDMAKLITGIIGAMLAEFEVSSNKMTVMQSGNRPLHGMSRHQFQMRNRRQQCGIYYIDNHTHSFTYLNQYKYNFVRGNGEGQALNPPFYQAIQFLKLLCKLL